MLIKDSYKLGIVSHYNTKDKANISVTGLYYQKLEIFFYLHWVVQTLYKKYTAACGAEERPETEYTLPTPSGYWNTLSRRTESPTLFSLARRKYVSN